MSNTTRWRQRWGYFGLNISFSPPIMISYSKIRGENLYNSMTFRARGCFTFVFVAGFLFRELRAIMALRGSILSSVIIVMTFFVFYFIFIHWRNVRQPRPGFKRTSSHTKHGHHTDRSNRWALSIQFPFDFHLTNWCQLLMLFSDQSVVIIDKN